ncbi:MAG: 50S ribosomal protein L35 [Spirochaetaceae bacterium 4572_7]|nr:MAG: 50S ribosomal protein L35 [Spirochaetaceae bacterium 4572_7]
MPKMKTRKSASKRYKVTGTGKVKYKSQGTRHILTKKSAKRKRKLRHTQVISVCELPRIKRLLPYG